MLEKLMLKKLTMYAGLVAGLALTIAAGVHVTAPAHAHFDAGSSLLVTNRDELRVCLVSHGAVPDKLGAQVHGALQTARQHPHWDVAGYGAVPEPDGNCTATLPASGVTRGVVVGPGLTAEPGPYRTVIVVLDEANAERYLGDQPAVLVPYELMKTGEHSASTVTQAVVVRADVIDAPRFATEYLTLALGLDPAAR